LALVGPRLGGGYKWLASCGVLLAACCCLPTNLVCGLIRSWTLASLNGPGPMLERNVLGNSEDEGQFGSGGDHCGLFTGWSFSPAAKRKSWVVITPKGSKVQDGAEARG